MITKEEVLKHLNSIHDDNLLLGLDELGMVENVDISGEYIEVLLYDRDISVSEKNLEKYMIKELLAYHFDIDEDNITVLFSDVRHDPKVDNETAEKMKVIGALKKVIDPELDSDIYELGLIYGVDIDGKNIDITMTLTSPQCPVAEILPEMAQDEVLSLGDYEKVSVNVVWEPMWTIDSMPYKTRTRLGIG